MANIWFPSPYDSYLKSKLLIIAGFKFGLPRKYLSVSKDAMKEVVKNKLEEFGAAGNASKIKPLSLSIMASRYQSGELGSITN